MYKAQLRAVKRRQELTRAIRKARLDARQAFTIVSQPQYIVNYSKDEIPYDKIMRQGFICST